jgi:hypothetical protein
MIIGQSRTSMPWSNAPAPLCVQVTRLQRKVIVFRRTRRARRGHAEVVPLDLAALLGVDLHARRRVVVPKCHVVEQVRRLVQHPAKPESLDRHAVASRLDLWLFTKPSAGCPTACCGELHLCLARVDLEVRRGVDGRALRRRRPFHNRRASDHAASAAERSQPLPGLSGWFGSSAGLPVFDCGTNSMAYLMIRARSSSLTMSWGSRSRFW